MGTFYLTKQQLYQKVETCRNKLKSNGITEINIKNICNEYPYILVDYIPLTTPGLRGLVIFPSQSNPFNRVIINSLLPSSEQQFHSIHEYMHIYLHSELGGANITCFDKAIGLHQDSCIEWQANEGAAELIIPYREFVPLFLKMYNEYSLLPDYWRLVYGNDSLFQVLASRYNVSVPVIKNRISTLSYEIDQYRYNTPIEEINLLSYT